MRFALTVAVTLLLIIAVSTAMAEPYVSVWQDASTAFSGTTSWYGNVGLIVTPTAQTPPAGGAAVQYHRIRRDTKDINIYGATFGVTNNIEAGATRIDQLGGGNETVGNVKIRLDVGKWLNNGSFPSVSVGAFDLTNQINRALYVVMSSSYKFGGAVPAINLHMGFASNDAGTGSLNGLFGGIDFQALRATVQAEYDGSDFNAALRYKAMGKLSLDIGTVGGDLGYGATYQSQF